MRTGGDDIAQALALIGARPTWDSASRRVTGFEVLPVSVLDRPRVDVTLRVSGFFRDAFPGLVDLFDSAVAAIAAIEDESSRDNPLAAQVVKDAAQLATGGLAPEAAWRQASYRVFGSQPGAYGAGLQALIDEKGWDTADDLAKAYVAWGGWATESGKRPTIYHNDHSRPFAPKIRTLEDEISRVVRARVTNPKWISGVMRHGYKGAFEMAATVDYLFAFSATTGAVRDDQFDAVHRAFLEDDDVRAFLETQNPAALREMAERFLEAIDRGLWQARSNSAYARLNELAGPPTEISP